MNLLEAKGRSFTNSGEQSLEVYKHTAFMRGSGPSADTQSLAALSAHQDARQLVRLVQCLRCSKPFKNPVTLPCGHTLCRTCLPSPQPRANISYPNTPDRQYGISCPVSSCQAEHPTGECNVDVTLTKVMDMISLEVAKCRDTAEETPTHLEEIFQSMLPDITESEKVREKPSSRVLHGGRLLSTFTLAEMGELDINSDVSYESMSATGDDYSRLDDALLDRLRETAHKELDCHVCYNLMLDPTTTSCGHTFCRRCLARVLDHTDVCPVCRRRLLIPASLETQPSNACLVALLNCLCPELVAARASAIVLEESHGGDELSVPLFVCTLSLPTMPTFLHIFEPRYRLMIRRCIQGNRQFGMLMYNRSSTPQGDLGSTQFMEYGTLLEIVNFELLRDGRSFVETRGISRFRVRDHGALDGYIVGRIDRVDDVSLADEERLEAEETTAALATTIEAQTRGQEGELPPEVTLNALSTRELLFKGVEFIERMRASSAPWLSQRIVELYGGPPDDPALFPYWFACVLPIADEEKYLLLRTTRVRERLKIVNTWIRRIEGQRWAAGNSCIVL